MNRRVERVLKLINEIRTRGPRVRAELGIPISRQLRDMWWFFRQLRTTEIEFYDFRLYDPAMPLDERLRYVSFKHWTDVNHLLNPMADRKVVKDKSLFAARMDAAGVPTPSNLGVIDLRVGRQAFDRTLNEIVASGATCHGIVIKPESGSNIGRGVFVFKTVEGAPVTLTTMSGDVYDAARLWAELNKGIVGWDKRVRVIHRFLVQPRLESHALLRPLNPHTLCTVRVVTLTNGGAIDVLAASFKVGVGTKGTDNYNDGGIAAAVDLPTGRIGKGFRKQDDAAYSRQPESGVVFEEMTLPFWPEALAIVRRAAAAVPEMRSLGWDVALTADGPIVIETNPDWASDLVQRPQLRGVWRPPLSTAYDEARQRRAGRASEPNEERSASGRADGRATPSRTTL